MHGARRAADRTRERAERELARLIQALGASFPLRRVFAFGSFARGDMHELSDIDLLLVGDFDQPAPVRGVAVRDVAWRIGFDFPLELITYTPKEFERARERPFLAHVLSEAIEIPLAGA